MSKQAAGRAWGAGAALLAAACGPSPALRTEAVVAPATDAPAGARVPAATGLTPLTPTGAQSALWRVQVLWEVEEASSQCFFFSGPGGIGGLSVREPLGTLARLERKDHLVTLTFDEGGQFRGEAHGKKLTLQRESSRQYRRATWRTLERIEGAMRGAEIEARYTYEECDPSGKEGCPGSCRISARITTQPTTAP